ncbi:MAG TPA: PAS domain-containing protein [Gemmatimonadales bacterium]|nr:PAS domain-containing protein [Gemmatimonadales bacterium]
MSPRRFRPKKAELQAENARLKAQLAERDHIEPRPSPDELLRIVEGGTDGCILLNDDLTIVYINEGAERVFGVSADFAIGKSVTALIPGDIIAQHAAQIRQLRTTSRPISPRRLSMQAAVPGGDILRLECTFAPRKYTGTNGWILLIRNLAAMQAVLESLDAVEQRYQALAEVVPVAIFRTDAQGRCLYVSRRWSELTGFGMLDSLGDGWRTVIYPADQERVLSEWDKWIPSGNGTPLRSEYRLRRADGSLIWVLAQVVPERDSTGRLLGYVAALTDITPEKQLEDALRSAEEQFRVIFRENPFAMWVYDRETLFFLDVNESAVDRYGWGREEFLRRKITDIRPPEDIPKVLEVVRSRPEGWFRTRQWRHRLSDGSVVPVETTSHPMQFNGRDAVLVAIRQLDPVTLSTPRT